MSSWKPLKIVPTSPSAKPSSCCIRRVYTGLAVIHSSMAISFASSIECLPSTAGNEARSWRWPASISSRATIVSSLRVRAPSAASVVLVAVTGCRLLLQRAPGPPPKANRASRAPMQPDEPRRANIVRARTAPRPPRGDLMAWDFSTEPEFQDKLDWVEQFCKEEVEPLDLVFPYAVRSPDPKIRGLVKGLQDQIKSQGLWAIFLDADL